MPRSTSTSVAASIQASGVSDWRPGSVASGLFRGLRGLRDVAAPAGFFDGFASWDVAGWAGDIFIGGGSCLPYTSAWNMVFSLMPVGVRVVSIRSKHIHMCMDAQTTM
jgi:hypothetical protein